jgi:hypothetical protein
MSIKCVSFYADSSIQCYYNLLFLSSNVTYFGWYWKNISHWYYTASLPIRSFSSTVLNWPSDFTVPQDPRDWIQDCCIQRVLKIYRDQAFLRSYMIRLLPPPLHTIYHQQDISLSQSSCASAVELTDGGWGGGGEQNQMTARKPCPLQIINIFLLHSMN